MRQFFYALAILACATPAYTPATAQTRDVDLRQAADALMNRFMQAWSASDAQRLSSLFASDADFINPWGTHAISRVEIESFYASALRSGFAGSKGEGDILSVRALSRDIAIIDARWRILGAHMPDGSPRADEKGILAAIIGRAGDGGWQILALRENASAADITALSPAR